jgi:hypothetical protein
VTNLSVLSAPSALKSAPSAFCILTAPRFQTFAARVCWYQRSTSPEGAPMPPVVANPKDQPAPDDEPEQLTGPPEDEDMWERYNKRLEFPIAAVGTVFLHAIVGAVIVFVVFGLLMGSAEDRSGPELKLMTVGGLDDEGLGSAGSGGRDDADLTQKHDPTQTDIPPPPALLDPRINPLDLDAAKLTDPKNMPKVGGPLGAGNQAGKGFDGTAGTGPGGDGSDSTRARGLRWVLRFRVSSGRDYIDQLKAMKAELLIPVPPDNKKFILISDLSNPTQKVAEESDLRKLAKKIQFSDGRPDQVRDVAAALNIPGNPPPRVFWAFFPKELEEELATKETGYRNRRSEDIEETIYRVVVRGGKYELIVDEQKVKK